MHSAGKVFNGLSVNRRDIEGFLRSGNIEAVASHADVELLADLRDVAHFLIDRPGEPLDAGFVRAVNATVIAPIEIPKVCSLKFLACEQQTHLAVSVSRRARPRIPVGKPASKERGRLERER